MKKENNIANKNSLYNMTTAELIQQLTFLERDIQLAVLKYNKYKLELIRRFPTVDLNEMEIKVKKKEKKANM